MRGLFIITVLSLSVAVATSERVSYEKYALVRVTPVDDEQLEVIKILIELLQVDVWKHPTVVNRPVDISVPPTENEQFFSVLDRVGLEYTVLNGNLQDSIDKERQQYESARLLHQPSANFDYSQYHNMDEINAWMTNLTTVYSMAKLVNISTSTEGRQQTAIVIRSPQQTTAARKGFWIEGGIHAREWISPATVLYMVGQMLDRYQSDVFIKKMVDSFDWHILPVTNPDGYVYSWVKDRMWRKTRSRHGVCTGVDPNRNWSFHWGEGGASSDPCSDSYRGPKAASEPEVKGVIDYLTNNGNFKGFIDFHSYSQLWMSPWGYTKAEPTDFTDQDKGSKVAVEALEKVHGTKYEHGTIADIIYVASGSSADWAYGVKKIKYSYGVELRDTGEHGFILPADEIIPTGEETLQALIALADFVTDN